MIRTLELKNFTVFSEAIFDFAPGINVVIGSNGTGKSHLLKLAYTVARWGQEMSAREKAGPKLDKATLQKELAGKLIRVFRPDSLGRLSRRGVGVSRAEVLVGFDPPIQDFDFTFSTRSTSEVTFGNAPQALTEEQSVFLPTKEMLSMFPGFAGLYRDYEVSIAETYYDLCLALDRPLLKGRRFDDIGKLLAPVETALGGSIRNENGKFYLVRKGSGNFEIPLVAEGFRKLGTIAYLIANGTLAAPSFLFWDEPETNLNPAYMTSLAELLVSVSRGGTQVFVATHSLYIMRELSLLLESCSPPVPRKFFALQDTNGGTTVSCGESAEDVEPIAALDSEIEQSQRYLNALQSAAEKP